MGHFYFISALFLLSCIYQINAIQRIEEDLDEPEFDGTGSVKKFKVHIKEKQAVFNEKIYIDKENDVEYFKVPAHNTLDETDNMYDFKQKITVSRIKKDRICRISPLPEDLPKPDVLEKGLKSLSHSPPSHKIEKIVMQWRMGPKVDKSTLRQKVRDFCGDFPVYRLLPYTPDSVSVGGSGKSKRNFKDIPLCDNQIPQCNPDSWIFKCRIRTDQCIYYVSCKLDSKAKMVSCQKLAKHLYHGLVCCKPSCPSG